MPLANVNVNSFLGIPSPPVKCQATYMWIDGFTGNHLRLKTRTLDAVPASIDDYPVWDHGWVDGNHKYFDIFIKPIAAYPDPFLGGNARLVICESFTSDMKPKEWNHRYACNKVMQRYADKQPWFGMEQEYLLTDRDGQPLGWPKDGYPQQEGLYYCGVGADKAFGREVAEAHYKACLYAGLNICGTNAGAVPGQWEYQLGICKGVDMGDQLWVSRYILHRVAEQLGVVVSFDPKPIALVNSDWSGSGLQTNYSDKKMRAPGGLKEILELVPRLANTHNEAIEVYDIHSGQDNARRLTGRHGTSNIDKFTWGVADRGVSVRIPRQVALEEKGYFEDRRPAANADPYQVMCMIVESIYDD